MKRRTKIVCTLGPAVDSRDKIKALIEAGMNVARLNLSHGDWDTRRRWIEWVRELSPEVGPVAILADLQGPKFRLGDIKGDGIHLEIGQTITMGPSASATLPVSQEEILAEFCPKCRILIGDGEVEVRLQDPKGVDFEAKVVSGGLVKSHQGLTAVDKVFKTACLTPKDLEDVRAACEAGADFLALSYVHHANDMSQLRDEVNKYDPTIRLCAKIETRQALKELDGILQVSDLIMVARGDMGLQMEIEEVPVAQKTIIDHCAHVGRPVITATQMLESMIHSPRPTRAEATDVANAILDGTDAVMLSGETASGEYPIECVKTMVRIAEKAETLYDRTKVERDFAKRRAEGITQTEAVAHAVCDLSATIKADAIVTTTTSGQTTRLVSKFRPKTPILCATWKKRTQMQMAVVWGVEAMTLPLPQTTDESIELSIDAFYRVKRIKSGDLVVVTAGVPAGTPGNTNLIFTQVV